MTPSRTSRTEDPDGRPDSDDHRRRACRLRREHRGPLPLRRVHRGHRGQGHREAPRPGGRHRRRTAPRRALAGPRAGRRARPRGPTPGRAGGGVRHRDLRRGGQAHQDRSGRGGPRRRHRELLRRRGPHAGRRADPARRLLGRRGEGGLGQAGAHRRRGRDLPVQLPPQPRVPQGGPGHRRRLPRRAQAGLGHAAVGPEAGRAADRRVRAASRVAERRPLRRVHRQPPGRAPRRGHDHLHRLTPGRLGHPGPSRHQEGRPGAGQQRPGRHRARRGLGDRGGQDQGGGVQPRRPVLHLDPAGLRPRGHRRGVHHRPRQGGRGPGRG